MPSSKSTFLTTEEFFSKDKMPGPILYSEVDFCGPFKGVFPTALVILYMKILLFSN